MIAVTTPCLQGKSTHGPAYSASDPNGTYNGEVNMTLKNGIAALALLALPHASMAQEVEKNGLPCVAEICLGDGIAELSKVRWDRAKNPMSSAQKPAYTSDRKVSERELKMLSPKFRGELLPAAAFLQDRMFDSEALRPLARVTAACDLHEVVGTYTTASGNPTRVSIALTPGLADTSTQRWTVVSIVRSFPAAVSTEQKSQVEAQLAQRYGKFGAGDTPVANAKPGEGRYSALRASETFGFHLSLFRDFGEANRLKLHPACGGVSKVKID